MTKVYENKNNGGREKVSVEDGKFYIQSYLPGMGWTHETLVSRDQVEACMSYTGAPSDVVSAILNGR
jgi:hypothetical protein